MSIVDLTEDPAARDLFEKNLEAIRRYDEALADRLAQIETPVAKIVSVDGDDGEDQDLNLDIGHTLFYDKGVRKFVDEQYDVYVKEPYRIDISWPSIDNSAPQLLSKVAIRRLSALTTVNNIRRLPAGRQHDITGFAVSLGVGIGDHIGRLLNDHLAQSLIVVEQFEEFLWHSMHLHPWHEWVELVESRNGRVFFILNDNPTSVSSALTDALRSDNGGTLDGTLIYTHYRSHLVREIHRSLSEQISYIGTNRGFFEDENIMIQNATRNFLARDYAIWKSRPRREKYCPAFVVAAGPSVDAALDTIRKYRDQVVLISCGSGLKVLLSQGIRPDYHVEVENTFGQADILERVASQHDLSGITLVSAATVNKRTAAVFDKAIFFHRDTVCSSRFYLGDDEPVYMAVPTVANGGVRFAFGMAFKEVYMFGVDLGSRIEGYHHSKASSYYTDEEFMYSFQGTVENTQMGVTNDGNLGGTVKTHDGFLLSRLFMQKLIASYPSYRLYNCSDGVDIPGAIPKLPTVVNVTAEPSERDRALNLIDKEISHFAKGEGVSLENFRDLRRKTDIWYDKARETIKSLKEEEAEKPDPFESYDRLWKLFQPDVPGSPLDSIMTVVWQNNFGTVMTMFNIYFRMHRRVVEEDSMRLFHLFLGELQAFLDDMEAILTSVIDELISEVEDAQADMAKTA